MGNEGSSKIMGIGYIFIEIDMGCKLVLRDVRHVLDIYLNMIYTKRLDDYGYGI